MPDEPELPPTCNAANAFGPERCNLPAGHDAGYPLGHPSRRHEERTELEPGHFVIRYFRRGLDRIIAREAARRREDW